MPVLIRHRAEMTPELYDQVSPPLIESVKQQPGFIFHVAYTDAKGFCVAEIWESQEAHDAWFNETVVSNVPAEISQEVVEIHAMVTP